MSTVFLLCAAIGGGILVLQLVLGFFGLADVDLPDHHDGIGDAMNLFSIRSLAAGLAFFGLGGLLLRGLGFPLLLAVPAGVVAGLAAAVVVAKMMRLVSRFEVDGSLDLGRAIGAEGTVYLSIPGNRSAPGKVHLEVQGRLVECQAISEQPLNTGAHVMVIDVLGSDVVEVAPSPVLGGILDAPR
jgi:hypothetical protein